MKQKTIVLASSLIFSFAVQNATAQTQRGLDIDGEAAGDYSGRSVSMPDSSTVAIGAFTNDGSGTWAGHVRVYSFCINTSSTISLTACDSYTVPSADETYTVSGTYSDTIPNAAGCDSVMTLNLTINSSPAASLTLASDTVCDNASAYLLSGGSPAGGNYSGNGVSGGNFNPGTAGSGLHTITYTYTDINACTDSANAQIVVEVCTAVASIAGKDNSIVIIPNPTKGIYFLRVSAENQTFGVKMIVQ